MAESPKRPRRSHITMQTSLLALLVATSPTLALDRQQGSEPIIRHTGATVGREEIYSGVNMYITGNHSRTAVVYLTDVYGIQLEQNKLLADSFGRAGFLTVAPDLFNGKPSPVDLTDRGFDQSDFNINAHGSNVTDLIVNKAVKYLRGIPGVENVAATGYCFGGRYAIRSLAPGQGVDGAFTAHPSLITDKEIKAIDGPISIATAETDEKMLPARRHVIEQLLKETGQPYSMALYGGTSLGFGVRANPAVKRERFGKEQAFWQAVSFFNEWADGEELADD